MEDGPDGINPQCHKTVPVPVIVKKSLNPQLSILNYQLINVIVIIPFPSRSQDC